VGGAVVAVGPDLTDLGAVMLVAALALSVFLAIFLTGTDR
jgi:hypothetical protein